ncbi:MAG TPA: response regulator [Bacteroidia bacterium]|jgi:CheY-like chemotaxis protein|nr:response regulator [Bacteroidia bacterium]
MHRHLQVLIVEDNPVNLKLTGDLLRMDGFTVHTCRSAEDAIEMLKEMLPDILLTDIGLPGMDGLQLTRIMKAEERTKGMKIIAITAFAMKGDSDRVKEAGCNGYITKPIDTRKFTLEILEIYNRP